LLMDQNNVRWLVTMATPAEIQSCMARTFLLLTGASF
jgi:hypothetical protein